MKRATVASDGLLPAVRAYFGLKQAELARLLGVSQSRVAEAETGRYLLPADATSGCGPWHRCWPPRCRHCR